MSVSTKPPLPTDLGAPWPRIAVNEAADEYDGRSIDDLAWRSCKPSGATPFAVDEEG